MISRFVHPYRFLSNFWPVRRGIVLDGLRYPTVEHAYQASKTLDIGERANVMHCETPGRAKRAGRAVTLRKDWNDVKAGVMRSLLRQKFAPGTPESQMLLETGDQILIEGNTWHDNFWGWCNCSRCSPKWMADDTIGNMLGKLLMQVRDELREASDDAP